MFLRDVIREKFMCDVKKINEITEHLLAIDFKDLQQLIVETESKELKDIYMYLYTMQLRKKQDEVLKEHVF